ncbi:MAG: hypothetical protein ACM3ZT_03510 [Bacillota bacterium]
MKAVLLSFLDVFLLRAGPQAFPRSRVLLTVCLLAYLLTDVVVDWLQGYSAVPMVLGSVFDCGYWLLAFTLTLGAWSVLPRLEQTLSAWFGAGLLFNIIDLPLAGIARLFPNPDVQAWLNLPVFLLILWSMAVMAHLLHDALRSHYALAVVVAAVTGTINILLSLYLFPLA